MVPRIERSFDGQVHLAKGKTGGDDGYIKAKLSIVLQVLEEFKTVFKTDAGLELNVSKTSILPKGVTAQAAFDITRTIMQATSSLAHLRNDFLVDSF